MQHSTFSLRKARSTPPSLVQILLTVFFIFSTLLGASTAHARNVGPIQDAFLVWDAPAQPPAVQPTEVAELSPEQSAIIGWIQAEQPKLTYSEAEHILRTVYHYAELRNIEPMVILALIRLESRFNPKAVSNHGALGLMQVLARKHRDKLQGRSPFNIEASVEVGTRILSDCIEKTGSLQGGLNCYSGGGGKAYNKFYREAHRHGTFFIITQLFAPDTPSTASPRQQVAMMMRQ
jgi:hypothetical protein